MLLNASKTQKKKKKKKSSKWIVSNTEEGNTEVHNNEGHTINETNTLTHGNSRKSNVKTGKRKLKKENFRGLKKAKLRNYDEVHETSENNEEGSEHVNDIHEIDRLSQNEDTSDRCDKEDDDNDEEEITDMQNGTVNGNLDSDNESSVSSLDSKHNSELSSGDSDAEEEETDRKGESTISSQGILWTEHLYKVEGQNKYILHLPYSEKFYFHGKLQVTLLYGKIEVFGYELNELSENKTLQLYSPRRCMKLGVKSMLPETFMDLSEVQKILSGDLKLADNDFQKIFGDLKTGDAILIVEKLFHSSSLIFNHYTDIDFLLEKEIVWKGDPVENDLGCLLDKRNVFGRRGLTVGSYWRTIKPKRCTVICGGKGVGKSTLLKFLINTQLTMNKAVVCLDFDPGQTEFTTPGCLSAVVLKKPLLGPNFTNITTPKKMAYLGIVNVALDPVKYMKAVNYIVESCREDPELANLPWFVNTMGFNKGIGLDIMVNIIRLLQPDGVVQIKSSDRNRNYEIDMHPNITKNYSVLSLVPVQDTLSYKLYILHSCARGRGVGFQSGFRPAELREFMILSYFSPVVSLPYCSLNAVQPRWIHFSKIYIAVNSIVDSNYILKAINGNLVGLCNIDGVECAAKTTATTYENCPLIQIAIQPEISPCFGIGLVRGIDCKEAKIYIVTPVSNEELENVNCLCLGNIDTPSSIYLKQKYVSEPTVYTDVRVVRNIQSLKYGFRYVPRFQKSK